MRFPYARPSVHPRRNQLEGRQGHPLRGRRPALGGDRAHNYHLPYATDTIQCDHVAAEAARRAWDAGARVVVLPTVPFGVQTGQLDIPLCLNLNPSTQAAMLADLAHSLDVQGIPKLVLLNGHGGNDFRQMIRELQPRVKCFLTAVSWYKVVDPKGHFTDLEITPANWRRA